LIDAATFNLASQFADFPYKSDLYIADYSRGGAELPVALSSVFSKAFIT
jgi:hypothetical protein